MNTIIKYKVIMGNGTSFAYHPRSYGNISFTAEGISIPRIGDVSGASGGIIIRLNDFRTQQPRAVLQTNAYGDYLLKVLALNTSTLAKLREIDSELYSKLALMFAGTGTSSALTLYPMLSENPSIPSELNGLQFPLITTSEHDGTSTQPIYIQKWDVHLMMIFVWRCSDVEKDWCQLFHLISDALSFVIPHK